MMIQYSFTAGKRNVSLHGCVSSHLWSMKQGHITANCLKKLTLTQQAHDLNTLQSTQVI